MPRNAAWLAICCLLLPAAPAVAERPVSLAYHGLRFLGLDSGQEAGLQESLTRALFQSRRLRVAPYRAELSEACKRDVPCHCRAGREQQTARVLFGNIGLIGKTFTFELVLVDTQSCAVVNSVFISESHDPVSAGKRLGGLVERLVTPPESVSETVVKDERDVDAVPAIVTVFTAKQLRQYGITSLEELFRLVPGFEVLDTNSAATVLHFGLPNTLLYLNDGVPLSNPMFNFRDLGKDLALSLNSVERIELVRGPGSVLWGPNAFLGLVNIIPRMPTEPATRLTAQARGGTLGTGDFFASAEQSHRYFRYFVSSTVNVGRGAQSVVDNSLFGDIENATPENWVWGNAGTTPQETDTYWDVVFKLEVLRRLRFLFNEIHHEDHYQIAPIGGSLLPPGQTGVWDKAHRLYALSFEDRLPHGFRYSLSGSRYEYKFWENFVIHPLSATVPKGSRYLQGNEVERQASHLLEGRLYHSLERGLFGNQALFGAAYLNQHMPDVFTDHVGIFERPTAPHLDLRARNFHHVSVFLQDDISLWQRFFLSGGVRWEGFRRQQLEGEAAAPFDSVVSGQAALVGLSRYLSGKLVFAQGFRPPEANQLYSTVGVKGDPTLRPERSSALSLELATRLGPVRVRGGGTGAWLTDQIVQEAIIGDPNFSARPLNRGVTTVWSGYGEVALEWPLLSAFAAYEYKLVCSKKSGDDRDCLENEPGRGIVTAPHTASLGLSFRPLNDLSFYFTGSFVSNRQVLAYVPGSAAPELRNIRETFAMSAGAWLTNIFNHFDLGLKAQNPFAISHNVPDSVTNINYFVERRRVTEVLFTLRASKAFDFGGGQPR